MNASNTLAHRTSNVILPLLFQFHNVHFKDNISGLQLQKKMITLETSQLLRITTEFAHLRNRFRNCWKMSDPVVAVPQLPCGAPRHDPFQLLHIWFGALV